MKKLSLFLAFLILFSLVVIPTTKAGYLTLEQEMEIAKRRQRESKIALKNEKIRTELLSKDYDDNLSHLLSINAEINSISTELERIKKETQIVNNQIIQIRNVLSETGKKVDLKRDRVNNLLKFINEISGKRFIDYVFSATDFSDLLSRRNSVNKILDAFIMAISDLRAESHEQIIHREKLENSEIRLSELKKKQAQEMKYFKSLKLESENTLKKVQSEFENSEKKQKKHIKDLEKWDIEIDRIMRSIRKRNEALKTTGKFIWPTKGYLSSDYGMRKHPIFRVVRPHTGIDIHADFGTPIRAAGKGHVYFLGGTKSYGYGYYIAIDHGNDDSGNNYRTLYGHLSRFATKLNANVEPGEVIGYVGSTGWSTSPHLHFEVRKNGDYVDPKKHLINIVSKTDIKIEYLMRICA